MVSTENRVFIFFAHPDDAEFGAAATVAQLVRNGSEVWYVICTGGAGGIHSLDMTPGELLDVREQEQRAAMNVLGVKEAIGLRYLRRPGEWGSPSALVEQIMRVIRQHRPDIIITHDPWRPYNIHPAHRMVGWAATEAAYLADAPWYFPQHVAEGLAPYKPRDIYLFGAHEPNYWVDVTETIDLKVEALRQHKTQLGKRVEPPQLEDFARRIKARSAEAGKKIGVEYAEAFHKMANG